MMPEPMKGQTPGSAGTVTTSGWSNAAVFRESLQDHFIKYVQGHDSSEPVLILYDGHRSHFSLDLIEWARTNNIILFVLPPHCSHILQPMDVGCFGPFQIKYSQECQTFSRCNGRIVSCYDVCALACKAYSAALTLANLRAAFAKTGIFPLKCASEMIRVGIKNHTRVFHDPLVSLNFEGFDPQIFLNDPKIYYLSSLIHMKRVIVTL